MPSIAIVLPPLDLGFGVSQKSSHFYDAENKNDFARIKRWYKRVNSVGEILGSDPGKAMQELEREACPTRTTSMCQYFEKARDSKKTVPGLWTAECIAVTMYTGDFHAEFNRNCADGNCRPYLIYTYLLLSAVKKLAAIDPIPPNEVLHRGLKQKSEVPRAKRIFCKTFTSTSTSLKAARGFGKTTLLNPSTRYGARIGKLSCSPNEEEVLLLPFESFDVREKGNENVLVFRSSDKQKLLKPESPTQPIQELIKPEDRVNTAEDKKVLNVF